VSTHADKARDRREALRLPSSQVREFRENGFLTISGAFTPAQVAAVRQLIEPMFQGFAATSRVRTKDVDIGAIAGRPAGSEQPEIDKPAQRQPQLVQTEMYAITRALASSLLGRPAYYIFDHAIRKMPRSVTPTPWHQDQAYLGKGTELGSVNFWIPLQAVDETNGTLFYTPRSHLAGLQAHQRSASLHPHVLSVHQPDGAGIPCALKLGDLTVHHPLTLHYAGPNNSDVPRTAWGIHFGRSGRLAYLTPRNLLGVLRNRFSSPP
jgi:hypothetical protein